MAFAAPLLANQIVLVIKESAVASIITVPELTLTASDIVASTYTYIGPYALLIACYWLLTQAVALVRATRPRASPLRGKHHELTAISSCRRSANRTARIVYSRASTSRSCAARSSR